MSDYQTFVAKRTHANRAARQLNRSVTFTHDGMLWQVQTNGSAVVLQDRPEAWRLLDADCPCCGDLMENANAVCWVCYRASNRLTPGTYRDPSGGTDFTITAENVARYDDLRAR